MKKIPYGIIDYKTLKEENYFYIDKTMYLEKLENSEKTLFYLRPGRFGKSLFTSMMFYYYDIKSENLFEALFKDTYIYNNTTPNKNNYYVIKFDFSGMDTAGLNIEEIKEKFASCVIDGINRFINYYKIDYEINYNDGADVIIKYFLNKMSTLDHKIYILIDEYDNFTNAMLEGDTKRFNSIVGNEGILKAFYAVIKTYIGLGVVDRFFATGICPVTLNSMTTGFNIATDLSMDLRFNSMIGLTHNEVLNLLSELGLSKEEKDKLYNIMIENYDGYLFSRLLNDEKRVFNATLVMYLLNYYKDLKMIPLNLFDSNITVNYGKIENLIKLQNNSFYKELISDILKNGEVNSELVSQFNLLVDFTRKDIVSLLYYFGYLTISKDGVGNDVVLRIPNKTMKETYNNYFIKMLQDIDIVLNDNKIRESLIEIISNGEIKKISEYVSEVLTLADNRTFMSFDEKYVSLLFLSMLIGKKEFNVYNEFPSNTGYTDIYIMGNKDYMKYNIMIELKYIKKGEFSDSLLDKKISEAKSELDNYCKDDRISKDSLKKYVVVYSGCDLKCLEEIG